MNVKTLKNIAAVLCVSALAVPAGVAAKGPSGDHGKSGDQHGQNQKPKHVNSRCKHQPKVGFSLSGTLDADSAPDAIIVDVTKSNKHSKAFVVDGKYAVPAGSTVKFDGPNPFTTAGADKTKYTVKVNGKVVKSKKGCPADTTAPTVKKVTVHAPDATPEQETQKPETESKDAPAVV
jgi:hypothetical protein